MQPVEIVDMLSKISSKLIVLEHALIGIREGATVQAADALVIHASDILDEIEQLKSSISPPPSNGN